MLPEDDISPTLSPFERLFIRQLDLENELDLSEQIDQVDGNKYILNDGHHKDLVVQYLDKVTHHAETKVEDYFKDLPWLNVSKKLSLANDLNGLISVCDFFTYCCINCLHIMPFLSQLEEKYHAKQIQFLGIHSPKFDNEKSLSNVSNAILRHKILHPVCNDSELKLWRYLSINCWPTVAIIGPESQLLFLLVGEKAIEKRLQFYLDVCLEHLEIRSKLSANKALLPISLLKNSARSDLLYFPTKIAISPSNSRIAIANTLRHSIIVIDTNGLVENIIGSNNSNLVGFQDGSFETSLFNYPQGLAWQSDHVLFVCDTENHAIRKIDFESSVVQTIAGNGSMCTDTTGGNIGQEQGLNSPWDLAFDSNRQRLYIAMAGSHQIWLIVLHKAGDVVNGVEYAYRTCVCLAGDGKEQKRNNRFALRASFAQPSGLALYNGQLYIADSESSSIRVIDLTCGSVATLVGGSANPLDLFAFGDDATLLQHCMAICATEPGSIYIADTFNHKIKTISIGSKKCQTLQINWKDSLLASQTFNEPNGLGILCKDAAKHLLICDTNNHRIVTIDLTTGTADNFNIYRLSDTENRLSGLHVSDPSNYCSSDINIIEKAENIDFGQKFLLVLNFNFANDLKAESGAKHKITICTKEPAEQLVIAPSSITTTTLNSLVFEMSLTKPVPLSGTLLIYCDLNLCNEHFNYCKFVRVYIEQPIIFNLLNSSQNCDPTRKCIQIVV